MNLFKKPAIIIIAKDQLCYQTPGSELSCLALKPADWKEAKVAQFVANLSKKLKLKSIKVLLTDDFSFNFTIEVKGEEEINRAKIAAELTKYIPADLEDIWWTYHILKTSEKSKLIQVFATSVDQLQLLEACLKDNQCPIQGFYSYPYALAQFFANQKSRAIYLYKQGKLLSCLITENGSVVFSTILRENDVANQLENIINIYNNEDTNKIEVIYLSHAHLVKDYVSLSDLEKPIKEKIVKIFNCDYLKNKNEADQILFFPPEKLGVDAKDGKKKQAIQTHSEESIKQEKDLVQKEQNKKPSPKRTILLFVLLIFMTAILGAVLFISKNKKDKSIEEQQLIAETNQAAEVDNSIEEQNSNVEDITPTPTELIEYEFVPANYYVQILNGSGIAGEAGRVENLLLEAEYTDIETANADRYDYGDTIIQTDDQQLLENLKSIIEESYQLSATAAALPTNSEFDAVITIGSNKK